uniref:Uncharacterized protein n=1 Tax=Micrurus paraensis TaxID=1970185 RepID=A0A2D4K763_9SAUR
MLIQNDPVSQPINNGHRSCQNKVEFFRLVIKHQSKVQCDINLSSQLRECNVFVNNLTSNLIPNFNTNTIKSLKIVQRLSVIFPLKSVFQQWPNPKQKELQI